MNGRPEDRTIIEELMTNFMETMERYKRLEGIPEDSPKERAVIDEVRRKFVKMVEHVRYVAGVSGTVQATKINTSAITAQSYGEENDVPDTDG